jgi:hypothetical protein
MDVRMPDGTLIRNVPEGTTQEELLSRYAAYSSSQEEVEDTAKEEPKKKHPVVDVLNKVGQATLAVPEVISRMITGMAGAGAGALGAGVAAIPDLIEGKEVGSEVRRGMEEGAERATFPAKPILKGTPILEDILHPTFEAIREGMGTGLEAMETARGSLAQNIHPAFGPQPEAARTLGEYLFDAPAAAAPFSMAKGLARRRPPIAGETIEERSPAPQTEPSPASTGGFDPQSIINRAITEAERPYKEPQATAYEIPDTAVEPAVSSVAEGTREAIARYREAGEVRANPITEQERTADAIRARRREMGAIGDDLGAKKGRDRRSVLDEIRDVEDQIRDAKNREEKDVVRFLNKELDKLKQELSQTDHIIERKSDPFKGPGSKQRGAIGEDLSRTELLNLAEEAYKRKDRKLGDQYNEEATRRSKKFTPLTEQEAASLLPLSIRGSGPGKKQRGVITPFASTTRERPRTAFEREENLPAGAGLAMPDLKAPLEQRVAETIDIGKDLAAKQSKEFLENLPNDMGAFSKYAMNPEQISKFAGTKNPVVKAVIDRISDKKRYWSGIREDLMKGADLITTKGVTALRYTRRAAQKGFNGIVERLGKNDQESFFKARLEFDQAKELVDAGLQWPTREMLAEKGYSNKVIDSYLLEAKYMDSAYDLINWARNLTGKDPIIRVPGYLPHTYKGHMAIKIFRTIRDEAGNISEKAPVGFTKASGGQSAITAAAEKVMTELRAELGKEGKPVELSYETYRTDKPGSTPDVIDALETVGHIFSNTDKPVIKLVKKVLDRRMASMEQQFLQASLKRSGVEGWIGSTGVTQKNLDQLIRARSNYMENAVKFAESQDILTSTTEAISRDSWNELNRRMPNTADFISKLVDVARERFPLSELDKSFLNIFAEVTGDRYTYRTPIMGLNKLRGFFSAKDLAWSTSYHTGNAIQPEMLGGTALMREYSRIGKGDPLTSMMLMEKEFIAPRLDNVRAIEWAAKNKVITPKLMEEIDFLYGKSRRFTTDVAKDLYTGRRASELNEAIGRLKTFVMGLEYYRSVGMTEMQARKSAAKFVDDVMVDYSSAGQPLWLSSNPAGQAVGRLVAPYAAFRHSFWGHTALAIQAMKNNPGMRRKFLPFLQLQLATATFGGLRGMAFMAEAVLLATLANAWWETTFNEPGPIPNPQKVLLEMTGENKGIGDFLLFGAISSLTKAIPGLDAGADLGSTVTSPSLSEAVTPRSAEGTVAALAESNTFFKVLFSNATDSEKLRLIKSLMPNFTHGMFEAAFMSDEPVTTDENNRMRGGVRREEEDWRARIITGKRSLNEQRQMLAKNTIMTEERQGRERKSDIVEIAADFMQEEGYIDNDLIEKAIDEGYSYNAFSDRVKDLIEERRKTRLQSLTGSKKRTRTRERIRERVDSLLSDTDY